MADGNKGLDLLVYYTKGNLLEDISTYCKSIVEWKYMRECFEQSKLRVDISIWHLEEIRVAYT